MTLGVREEHENELEYSRRQRDEIVGIWYPKSVFQADPGASSRAECHHGPPREYEQETCVPFAPLAADPSFSPASIAERKGQTQ